jgi:uncharacterized membrane protein
MDLMKQTDAPPPAPAQRNIEAVARMEREFLDQRDWKDKLGDSIANFIGKMSFILFHAIGIAVWFFVNSGAISAITPFDPFPYVLLTMIVSLEGVLIAAFVLMKQNRMSRRADQRDHLNLQIDLLAEKEITKMLELQRLICRKLGVEEAFADAETKELAENTAVETLARELEHRLPE